MAAQMIPSATISLDTHHLNECFLNKWTQIEGLNIVLNWF